MVGGQGGSGGRPAVLSAVVGAAYHASAQDWAEGPARMYGPLAEALVRAAVETAGAGSLAGRLVLDLGAGTGVAGRAALAAGARRVVCADLALGMLRRCRPELHPVAADAMRLPFRDRSFDLVLAAFSLSHLPSLAAGLAEIRRTGLALAASAFPPDWTHPAKEAADAALVSFGYQQPAWHAWLKDKAEPAAGDAAQLAARAEAAGFTIARTRTITVPTGLSTPAELAAWRLGMAQVAPFVRALEPSRQADLRRAAELAVAEAGCAPLTVPMLVLTAA